MAIQNQDDFFKSLAGKKEKELEQEKESRGSFTPYDWTAFTSKSDKILRFCSPIIPTKTEDLLMTDQDGKLVFSDYDARTALLVTGINDEGKKKHMIVPSKKDDPMHIYWRVWDKVMAKEYIDDPENPGKKKGVPKYASIEAYKPLIDRFQTNGYNLDRFGKNKLHNNKFDNYGLKAREILLANVIDRSLMESHREKKHTFLLSKNVGVAKDGSGTEFYDFGIPASGLVEGLLKQVTFYGPLNNFDVYIKRTGEKKNPWEIKNAKAVIAEVPQELHPFINNKPRLTDEELSWEQYDISKVVRPALYKKWKENFSRLFMEVDLLFKTRFVDELNHLVEKETQAYQQMKAEESSSVSSPGVDLPEEAPKQEDTSQQTESATPRRRKKEEQQSSSSAVTLEVLKEKGYNGLKFWNDDVANLVSGLDDKGMIAWKPEAGPIQGCVEPEEGQEPCPLKSPSDPSVVKGCLYCGEEF